MFVKKISLYNFRNYKNLDLELNKKVNILLGENGQGKTNLLEALFLLSQGASFRPSKTINFISKNEISTFCKAEITTANIDSSLTLKIVDERKKYFLNEKPTSSTKMSTFFKTILFSPESLASIKEGPEKRRQLADETITLMDPQGKFLLDDFKKCQKMRNKLLKDHKNDKLENSQFLGVLNSLNEKYLPICFKLTKARIDALKGLTPYIKTSIKRLFPEENVEIAVEYLAHSQEIMAWSDEDMKKLLSERMEQLKAAEIDAGISLFGPQKHDISFLFQGENSRYFCSQGQQRALILSVKMAEVLYYYNKFQDYPVLLLDDVMSELDEKRRGYLLEFLSEVDAQIFISTTDLSINKNFFENKKDKVTIFNIKNGKVKE